MRQRSQKGVTFGLLAGMTFAVAALFAFVAAPLSATPAGMHPDFSAVQSKAAAEALVARGKLVRVLLFPAELGGQDDAANVAYITPEAEKARALIVVTLMRMVKNGTVDHMDVQPAYKGRSIVPSSIRMVARHGSDPGSFEPSIEVW